MADQLNMGGLSMNDQPPAGARSYIPPHMRSKMGAGAGPGAPPPGPGGPDPAMNGGLNNSAWAG